MPPKKARKYAGEYMSHFFKFLAVFIFIIGLSLFFFSFTAGIA